MIDCGMRITHPPPPQDPLQSTAGGAHAACGGCPFMPRKQPVSFAFSPQIRLRLYLTGFSLQCLKKGVQ